MKKDKNEPLLLARLGILDGQQFYLKHDLIIGRDEECELVLDDRQVSRKHSKIFHEDENFYIQDLDSKNGTYLNGKIIHEIKQLHEGDIINVGFTQEFIFLASDSTIPLLNQKSPRLMIKIDKDKKKVYIKGEELIPPLSAQQYLLFELLVDGNGQVIKREDIIKVVWDSEGGQGISDQAIDALVRRLRERIKEFAPNLNCILTVRGFGYRLNI